LPFDHYYETSDLFDSKAFANQIYLKLSRKYFFTKWEKPQACGIDVMFWKWYNKNFGLFFIERPLKWKFFAQRLKKFFLIDIIFKTLCMMIDWNPKLSYSQPKSRKLIINHSDIQPCSSDASSCWYFTDVISSHHLIHGHIVFKFIKPGIRVNLKFFLTFLDWYQGSLLINHSDLIKAHHREDNKKYFSFKRFPKEWQTAVWDKMEHFEYLIHQCK